MQRNILSLLFLALILTGTAAAQQDITIGSSTYDARAGGGFYNYSDPNTLNIKVSVWGYVRFPGRYNIPIYTTPMDLLSYAGGPLESADLDEIRVYRVREDGSEEIIFLNFNDIVYEDKLLKNRPTLTLKASDNFIIPGGPKYFFRDWLSISLSIFSALVSLTILVLNISRN